MKIRQSQTKRQIRQKRNRQTKKRKQPQRGGDALSPDKITPILNAINGDANLQTMINTELSKGSDQLDKIKTLNPLIENYNASARQYHLYDLIYKSKVLTTYNTLIAPNIIWDHDIKKPESITAGMPGTHVYVYENPTGNFNLLGVIITPAK